MNCYQQIKSKIFRILTVSMSGEMGGWAVNKIRRSTDDRRWMSELLLVGDGIMQTRKG